MLSTEREPFDDQIRLLCAGFNIPPTSERLESYWTGLQRMNLPAFVRIVEHALGPSGPEKFPTVSSVWGLHRDLRARARPSSTAPSPSGPELDAFTAFGNRALVEFLRQNGAAAGAVLEQLVEAKNTVAEDLRGIDAEDRISAEEAREAFFRAYRRVHRPMPARDVEEAREAFCRERSLIFMPRAVA